MIADGYTVSQVATCVGAATPRQQDLWLRRLRHWTTMGVLDTLGGQHVGTGRERLYGPEAIYLAAVLLGLGDLGLPIGVLKEVGKNISARLREDRVAAELWEEAKHPRKELGSGMIYLGLIVKVDDESAQEALAVGVGINRGRGALFTAEFWVEESDTIIVRNLTQIFGRVKL